MANAPFTHRANLALQGTGLVLATLGTAVVAAWLTGAHHLTRIVPSSSEAQFVTGLTFIAAAAALLWLRAGRHRAAAMAAVPVWMLAVLTVVEYVAGAHTGFESALPHVSVGPVEPFPGRMAVSTAVSFLLAGVALDLIGVAWRRSWSLAVAAMLGALVIANGAVAVVGYATDLSAAYEWIGFSRMALLTAVAFVVLGTGIVLAAACASGARRLDELPWLAASAGVGMAALALLAWRALRMEADAGPSPLADVALALGLGVAALIAGVLAQSLSLRVQARDLAAANAALAASAAEVEDLYDRAPCGYHSLDAQGRIVRINRTELEWLGRTRAEVLGRSLTEFITPASRAVFAERFPAFRAGGKLQDVEIELLRKDGTTMPVQANASAVRDTAGGFVMSRSTLHDLSERKRAEQALRDSERRLQALLESLQSAVVVHAADTTIRYANPAAAAILGLTQDQLLGRSAIDPHWHFVRENGTPMPLHEYPVSRAIRQKSSLHGYVVGIDRGGGAEIRWALVNAIPSRATDGSVREVIVSFVDITERKRAAQEWEHRARTDALTGLTSRGRFLELAGHELSRSRRHGRPLALVLLDVDRFKAINDARGHAAGDAVLQCLARVVHSTLRDQDVAGRLGGEEFCLLLPETPQEAAVQAAERLRHAIMAAEAAVPEGPPVRFTASIGVADLRPEDASIEGLMRRADRAMYLAKGAGRNQVRVADDAGTAAPKTRASGTPA